MSSSVSMPLRHLIGVLMSEKGRFLMCGNCHLTFEFLAGEHFDTIAQKFNSCLCNTSPPEADDPFGKCR
jgi:hypothetical protein